MINPQRGERRTLHVEEGFSARGLAPIFPELPQPYQGALQLDNRYWVRGEPLDMRPGLLDTDTIDMPGVGARAIYSSILPRDETRYFRNAPEDMDEFERLLAIVSFRSSFLSLFSFLALSFLLSYSTWNVIFTGNSGCCGG